MPQNDLHDSVDQRQRLRRHFVEYIAILARWRILIALFTLTILALSCIYLWCFVPNVFESQAAIKSSTVTQVSSSGLGSMLDVKGLGNIGGLLGIGKSETDLESDVGILQSKSVLMQVVQQFNLMKEYNAKYYEDAVKTLKGNVKFDADKESQILTISVQDTSPRQARQMCQVFVQLLDSLNKSLSMANAKNSEEYLAIRYNQCIQDMGAAEDSLRAFQLKYKIYDMTDQMTASIKAAAQVEGDILLKETQANVLSNTLGANDADTKRLFDEVAELKKSRRQLDTGMNVSNSLHTIVPFDNGPELMKDYFDKARDVAVQEKLFALIYPLYEQARVEVERNTPTLLVLDAPSLPEKKVKPLRSVTALGVSVVAFLIAFLCALGIENVRRYAEYDAEKYNMLRASLQKILPRFLISWL